MRRPIFVLLSCLSMFAAGCEKSKPIPRPVAAVTEPSEARYVVAVPSMYVYRDLAGCKRWMEWTKSGEKRFPFVKWELDELGYTLGDGDEFVIDSIAKLGATKIRIVSGGHESQSAWIPSEDMENTKRKNLTSRP